jgi:peptidoglycan hydrolase CwlO-like protein
MQTKNILLAGCLMLALAGCNNSNQNNTAAEVITPEDSTAFEVKASAENLEQQAEELDQEVDSLVNSLN